MTLRIPVKVIIHMWLYDFYDMTLSTGKQRHHMISTFINIVFFLLQMQTYTYLSDFFYMVKIKNSLVIIATLILLLFEPPRDKTNNVGSEQVRHKPTCTSAEKS